MSDNGSGRDEHGRFQPGNRGGPGRPARAIERQYVLCISEAVSLDDWKRIISKAREDAIAGDDRARSWLAHYLIGDRVSLLQLAALERLGIDGDREIEAVADLIQNPPAIFELEETPAERALNLINQERAAAVDRLERAAKEKRKADRAAQKAAAQKAEVTT